MYSWPHARSGTVSPWLICPKFRIYHEDIFLLLLLWVFFETLLSHSLNYSFRYTPNPFLPPFRVSPPETLLDSFLSPFLGDLLGISLDLP